jgi:DNA replication protein DnaC
MVENTSTSTSFYQETGKYKICTECGAILKEKQLSIPNMNWNTTIFPICKCESEKLKREEEEEKEKQRKIRLDRLFKQSRLGERFKTATFDKFKVVEANRAVFDKMQDYAENFNQHKTESIFLHSHPGTGKTFLASCVANKLMSNGRSVIFLCVPDLLSQIRATYNKANAEHTEERLMSGLSECELLILDDIGAEKHTSAEDWANEKLFQIINNRYLNNKAIIFTTNLNANELHQKLSARTFSRICEMCNRDFVDMNVIKDIRIYGI